MWRYLFLAIFIMACSSQEKPPEYIPLIHPAAYGADGFNVYTPSPERKPKPDAKFYFKECSASGGKSFYSRTSYVCDEL